MADHADYASDAIERELSHHLATQQQAAAAGRKEQSAIWCEECGEVIPHQRRKALPGIQHCVECQQQIELKHKQQGKKL